MILILFHIFSPAWPEAHDASWQPVPGGGFPLWEHRPVCRHGLNTPLHVIFPRPSENVNIVRVEEKIKTLEKIITYGDDPLTYRSVNRLHVSSSSNFPNISLSDTFYLLVSPLHSMLRFKGSEGSLDLSELIKLWIASSPLLRLVPRQRCKQ